MIVTFSAVYDFSCASRYNLHPDFETFRAYHAFAMIGDPGQFLDVSRADASCPFGDLIYPELRSVDIYPYPCFVFGHRSGRRPRRPAVSSS